MNDSSWVIKIGLGTTFKLKGGGFAVAWDVKSNLIEWHYFHCLSDVVNDDYYDKQYWTSSQFYNFYL